METSNPDSSLQTLLERLVVVLVEPWEPGNVGATCRGMNHFGCTELRLVVAAEEQRRRLLQGDARRFATHALGTLQGVQFPANLDAAVADCQATFAFTARHGRLRAPRNEFREASEKAASLLKTGRVALMFGTEEKGLSREHLTRATDLVQIPLPGPHGVLNLSQAVLLGLWEVARACGSLDLSPAGVRIPSPKASLDERRGLERDFDQALDALDYGHQGPGSLHHRVLRRFMEMFDRAGHERDDASMMRGVAKRIRHMLLKEES